MAKAKQEREEEYNTWHHLADCTEDTGVMRVLCVSMILEGDRKPIQQTGADMSPFWGEVSDCPPIRFNVSSLPLLDQLILFGFCEALASHSCYLPQLSSTFMRSCCDRIVCERGCFASTCSSGLLASNITHTHKHTHTNTHTTKYK